MRSLKHDYCFLSIIVATVDRSEELERLFRSFRNTLPPGVEVIVVDQNDDPRALRIASAEAAQAAFTVKYYRLPVRHAGKARNFGARAASGEWLAFADDDCEYLPSTIPALQAAIGRDRPAMVLGGARDYAGNRVSGADRGRGKLRTLNAHRNISETSLFVRRALFEKLGGFDENYGPGSRYRSAEGLEFALRAVTGERGALLMYDSAVQVRHPQKLTFPGGRRTGAEPTRSPGLPAPSPDLPTEAERTRSIGYWHAYGAGAVIRKYRTTAWAAAYIVLYGVKFAVKLLIYDRERRRFEVGCLRGFMAGLLRPWTREHHAH